jgi:hypothetical protein
VGGLAGAVNAALGIHVGIEPVRRRATANPAIGEIEGRRLETEKRVIALRIGGGYQRRRSTALPVGQARLEQRLPVSVGAARRQYFVAARDQFERYAVFRLRGCQRIDENMDAVIAGNGGEAEIGDDEPLGGARIAVVIEIFALLRLRHHHVDAGFERTERLINGKSRGDLVIERRGTDCQFAAPHQHAARSPELIDVVAAQAGLKVAAAIAEPGDSID